jgi:uncharacterized phage protein gp47/JayE
VNWAKAASAEVVAAAAGPDPIVPGTVDVLLSGPGGASVSATALAAVTSYINARVPLGARVSVQTVQVLQVQPGVPIPAVAGSGIFIFSAQFASATLGITAALAALQARVTIGGTVYLSQVVDAIQNVAGVRNIEGLVLIVPAGSLANTTPGDVALAPGQGVQFVAPAPATLVAV